MQVRMDRHVYFECESAIFFVYMSDLQWKDKNERKEKERFI
jgi:hypothetical protein